MSVEPGEEGVWNTAVGESAYKSGNKDTWTGTRYCIGICPCGMLYAVESSGKRSVNLISALGHDVQHSMQDHPSVTLQMRGC